MEVVQDREGVAEGEVATAPRQLGERGEVVGQEDVAGRRQATMGERGSRASSVLPAGPRRPAHPGPHELKRGLSSCGAPMAGRRADLTASGAWKGWEAGRTRSPWCGRN